MMRTYRLVADAVDDGENHDLAAGVCIDVILRSASKEELERVEKFVINFLDAQYFIGSWVDNGTDRTEAITLA